MDIREMLDEVDMEDFLTHDNVDYKKGTGQSGVQLNLRECPFCGGDEWKVYMNAESGLGNCFHGSCGTTFNKFTYIRALHDTDNAATFQYIKDYLRQMGWMPPRKHTFVTQPQGDVELPEYTEIVQGTEAYNYLAKRGFGEEDIEQFGWVFCEHGSVPIIKQDGAPGRQYFDDRIIIPIANLHGKLQTFQGRDITGEADRKYLFPRGYPASGKFLYNAQHERGKPSVVVGEGVFDVAAIKAALRVDHLMNQQFGAIGTFGKHMSASKLDIDDQLGQFIALKGDGLKRVIFMWDSEKEAMIAALKAAMQLQAVGLEVSVCRLPSGKDPNEVDSLTIRRLIRSAKVLSYSDLASYTAIITFSHASHIISMSE